MAGEEEITKKMHAHANCQRGSPTGENEKEIKKSKINTCDQINQFVACSEVNTVSYVALVE